MPMSRKIAEEVLPRLRQRYVGRGREGRSRLIDEFCEQWDYSRKHVIKLLGGKAGWGGELGSRKGRPPLYGEAEGSVLWRIWKAAEQPCDKRLNALLPEVLHGILWLAGGCHEKPPLWKHMIKFSASTTDACLDSRRSVRLLGWICDWKTSAWSFAWLGRGAARFARNAVRA